MLSFKKIAGIMLASVILAAPGLTYAAWTEPTVAAPSLNVSAPINVGSVTQTKSGIIGATGFSSSGSILATGAIQGSQICVGSDCRSAWPGSGWTGSGAGTAGNMTKWTAASTLGNSQVYDNGTNVGIGDASPARKLDVNGDIRLANYIVSGSSAVGFLTDANGALPIKAGSLAITGSYSNNAPANGLYVEGGVGIGTTAPTQKLDVNGYIAVAGKEALRSNGGLWLGLNNGGAFTSGVYAGSAGALRTDGDLQVGANGGKFLVDGTTGNVGIGTISPTEKLYVIGSIHATTGINIGAVGVNPYYFDSGGNIVANTVDTNSVRSPDLNSVAKITFQDGSAQTTAADLSGVTTETSIGAAGNGLTATKDCPAGSVMVGIKASGDTGGGGEIETLWIRCKVL